MPKTAVPLVGAANRWFTDAGVRRPYDRGMAQLPESLLPESFQVRLPLWYLVHRGTAEINAAEDPVTLGLSIGHLLLKLDFGDGKALAMFSDEQRAATFGAATGLPGLLSPRVTNVTQLYDLLVRLTPDTTHVGFDPPPPASAGGVAGAAPVVPVADMLATLRAVRDVE